MLMEGLGQYVCQTLPWLSSCLDLRYDPLSKLKNRGQKIRKKRRKEYYNLGGALSATLDLAYDFLDGSSDHIRDQHKMYGFNREGPNNPGLPIIYWKIYQSLGHSYSYSS